MDAALYFLSISSVILMLLGPYGQMAPAAGASGHGGEGLQPGGSWLYELHSNVLLSEKGVSQGLKEVGFMIACDVNVNSVWGNDAGDRLLRVEVIHPNLYIKSRKAPAPEGFITHTSKLDTLSNKPFLIHWSVGRVQKILLAKDEPLPIVNLKKGIASLLQYQIIDQETNETDASGSCQVTYISTGPNSITKSKTSCLSSSDTPYINHPERLMGTDVTSKRNAFYELNPSDNSIKTVSTVETHEMSLATRGDVGNRVRATQFLKFKHKSTSEVLKSASSLEAAVEQMATKEGAIYTQESLMTEREVLPCDDCKAFHELVSEYKDSLKKKLLGSLAPAKVAIKLIAAARIATPEYIGKALSSKKNEAILPQLYDILGYVQTPEIHNAVMKRLYFDNQKHEESSERYLWALSMSSQPNAEVIEDVLKRYKKAVTIGEKVKETMLLTIASMAYHYRKLPQNAGKTRIYQEVEETILNGMEGIKGPERYPYLRALKNLKSENTIKPLLKIIRKGKLKDGVLAWKALHAFEPQMITEKVLRAATKTFFQLDRKHDSSSRTLALDIILASKPNNKTLKDLVYFLLSSDKSYEIKQYLIQRLKMMSDRCPKFRERLTTIISADPAVNNYAVLGQRGLSTALSREFLRHPSSNGSLITMQEMQGGIVKRGIVNVVLENEDDTKEMFSLGIFTGGLGSFLSSSSDSNEASSDESAVAGMELTILGTQVRPFTFFTGQGELMGHVWSGTGSERTTAYQALAMTHDHLEYIRLGTGFVAELDLKGVISFDLSGKIEVSLWNRNAESLVEKSAGIYVVGLIRVDTSFVRSQTEFTVSLEPKLSLKTDVDFYSNVNLCMRLSQPDAVFRHNIFKVERIPGSKHRLRKAKYREVPVPGKCYALNKKNSDMCNSIFKK